MNRTMRYLASLISAEADGLLAEEQIRADIIGRVGQIVGRPVEPGTLTGHSPNDLERLLVEGIENLPNDSANDLLLSPEVRGLAKRPGDDDIVSLLTRHPTAADRRALWRHMMRTLADWDGIDTEEEEARVDALRLDPEAEAVCWTLEIRSRWAAVRDHEVPLVLQWVPDPMTERMEALLEDAQRHGRVSGDPDYEVGDLQQLVWAAWRLLTGDQRQVLLASDEAEAIRTMAGDDENEAE